MRNAQRADFQLKGTTSILLVPSTDDIAFLLVILLLVIVRRGMLVVTLIAFPSVILIIRLPIIPLLQPSFQLIFSLSELFNRCGEGLHLPLQRVGWVFGLLVSGGH